MIDVANIRPLHEILGVGWRSADVMWLFEPDVKAQLLIADERQQRIALTTAINAVARTMMTRYRRWGVYRLEEMQHFYQRRQIANVGTVNRAQLDALFAEPVRPPVVTAGPIYQYPLQTFCGIAWREPVTDFNPGDNCKKCRYLSECHRIVTQHDGFALCEIILENDPIPMEVLYA